MDHFVDDAFITKIVNRYSDTIVRIAVQYVKNQTDAEDIMQEVFLALMKHPPFEEEEYLKAWLIRVTINKSKNAWKSIKRKNEVDLGAVENVLTEEQSEMLEELRLLSEIDRNVIYLFYYEGYTAKEIAKMLQKKEKTILMRLSRARTKIRRLLEE